MSMYEAYVFKDPGSLYAVTMMHQPFMALGDTLERAVESGRQMMEDPNVPIDSRLELEEYPEHLPTSEFVVRYLVDESRHATVAEMPVME